MRFGLQTFGGPCERFANFTIFGAYLSMEKRTQIRVEHLPITALKAYVGNARTHSEEQVAELRLSIRQFGFVNPVLIDAVNEVIAGHGRLMAAELEGLKTVPCIRLGYLSDDEKRALRIADNKIALKSGWDFEKLTDELRHLADSNFDLGLTGFSSTELDALLATPIVLPPSDEPMPKPVVATQPPPPTTFKPELEPAAATNAVTDEQLDKTKEELEGRFANTERPKLEVCCPECAHVFHIDR